jgi:hypothetical protein
MDFAGFALMPFNTIRVAAVRATPSPKRFLNIKQRNVERREKRKRRRRKEGREEKVKSCASKQPPIVVQ